MHIMQICNDFIPEAFAVIRGSLDEPRMLPSVLIYICNQVHSAVKVRLT